MSHANSNVEDSKSQLKKRKRHSISPENGHRRRRRRGHTYRPGLSHECRLGREGRHCCPAF